MCFLLVALDWSYTRLNSTGSACVCVCVRPPPLRSRGFALLYYNPHKYLCSEKDPGANSY